MGLLPAAFLSIYLDKLCFQLIICEPLEARSLCNLLLGQPGEAAEQTATVGGQAPRLPAHAQTALGATNQALSSNVNV
jgi:hypothetical protein